MQSRQCKSRRAVVPCRGCKSHRGVAIGAICRGKRSARRRVRRGVGALPAAAIVGVQVAARIPAIRWCDV